MGANSPEFIRKWLHTATSSDKNRFRRADFCHLEVNCPEGARETTLGCPQRGRLWATARVAPTRRGRLWATARVAPARRGRLWATARVAPARRGGFGRPRGSPLRGGEGFGRPQGSPLRGGEGFGNYKRQYVFGYAGKGGVIPSFFIENSYGIW